MMPPGFPPLGFRLPLPSTRDLLWFGGLAGLAALEVIEWPVAVVVAAGTYVAEQQARQQAAQQAKRAVEEARGAASGPAGAGGPTDPAGR